LEALEFGELSKWLSQLALKSLLHAAPELEQNVDMLLVDRPIVTLCLYRTVAKIAAL